jgi:hypothetical protein
VCTQEEEVYSEEGEDEEWEDDDEAEKEEEEDADYGAESEPEGDWVPRPEPGAEGDDFSDSGGEGAVGNAMVGGTFREIKQNKIK